MINARINKYIPSLAIALPACLLMIAGPHGFTSSHVFPQCLYYHFFHANIWHLLGNLLALFLFHPRWKTLGVAYASATLSAIIPGVAVAEPTCGMSAILYACFARSYAANRRNPIPLLALNMAFVFIPAVNWRIHLAAFVISYVTWLLITSRRKG